MNLIQTLLDNHLKKFIRFSLVGVLNTVIDLGVFTGLYYGFGMGALPAHISGFFLAVVNSFILNSLWTFKGEKQGRLTLRLLLFLAVAMIGLVLSSAVLLLLMPLMPVLLAKFLAVGVTLLWNYSASRLLVFR